MDKMLKVALMLTAIDKMSSVVSAATGKSLQEIDKVSKGIQKMRDGMLMMAAGKQGLDLLSGPIEAFGKLQAAGNRLETTLMRPGGVLDSKTYDRMMRKSQELSEKYANTSEEYLNMMRLLKNNGITEEDILGKVGEANEKLAVALDVAPSQAAMFVAHMKRDMGIANNEMEGMMDLIARLHNVGVGETGGDAINQMNQFFSKEGLSASILKSLGLEEAKSVSAIAGLFIRRGLSGQTVGTNFRRMLDTMRNPKAMDEVNAQAKKYGITLDLFDKKTHQFKGFANMVQQFDKLRGMDVQVIDKITHAFGGRQGLSNDFIALLSTEGVKDFNEVMHDMYGKQATLDQKIQVLISGQEYKVKRLHAAWFNFKANFGAALAPTFEVVINKLTAVTQWLGRFADKHPTIMRYVGTFIAIASMLIMAAGAVKIFMGAWMLISGLLKLQAVFAFFKSAFFFLRLVLPIIGSSFLRMAGQAAIAGFTAMAPWLPLIAVIILVGLILYGVYKVIINHFGSLGAFWDAVWGGIKKGTIATLHFLKYIFFDVWVNMGKAVWDFLIRVVTYFALLDVRIRAKFAAIVAWFMGLGPRFLQAGKNIVTSIGDGISAKWHTLINKVKGLAAGIRAFFPFSPAKEGPLRDIHRIKLVETIADSLRPDALISKMRAITGSLFDYRATLTPQQVAGGSMQGGGGASVVVQATFNYYAAPGEMQGTGSQQMNDWFRRNVGYMVNQIEDELRRRNRLKYS